MLNRIRLPFYLSKPQYPAEEDIYLKGNGVRVVLKSIVSKVMEGRTDYMPYKLHERLTIALRHDEVNVESEDFTGSIRMSGAYDIAWIEFLNYPVAPANFKAFEEEFVARSNKCDICDPAGNLTLENDAFESNLDEGTEYSINVAANDEICCDSPVFSILSFDIDYVDTIDITQLGVVTLTLKAPLDSAPDKLLFTYKVTCGNGQEATADVYATVEGSNTPLCESPLSVATNAVDPSDNPAEIHADWIEPSGGPPTDGYYWQLLNEAGDTVISFGSTTDLFVNINSLDCDTTYKFRVRSVCDDSVGDFSSWVEDEITTTCEETKNIFLVNETGGAVQVDVDGFNWNFATGVNGNMEIFPNSVWKNESGSTLKFRFLQSMPATLIIEQVLANNATYILPADVSLYNYVRVSIP